MILLVLVVAVLLDLVALALVLVIVVSIVTLTGTVVVALIKGVVGAPTTVPAQLLGRLLGLLSLYSSSSSL